MKEKLIIKKEIVNKINNLIGGMPPETGGILGKKDEIICEFYCDTLAETSKNAFRPNVKILNKVIEQWYKKEIYFSGIIHSHECNKIRLSYADIEYANEIIRNNDLEYMYMFIYNSQKIYAYKVFNNSNNPCLLNEMNYTECELLIK